MMLLRGWMTLLRIGAIEFGVLLLLLFGAAVGQTARRGWKRWLGQDVKQSALRVEELLLGAAAVVTGAWYLRLEMRAGGRGVAGMARMAGISRGWVVGYGAVCAVYLVAKCIRVRRGQDWAGSGGWSAVAKCIRVRRGRDWAGSGGWSAMAKCIRVRRGRDWAGSGG